METEILGIWITDNSDLSSMEIYGEVRLEFKANGEMVYTIFENNMEKVIFLDFQVQGDHLITNQRSDPNLNKTRFQIINQGSLLELYFQGIRSAYIRIS